MKMASKPKSNMSKSAYGLWQLILGVVEVFWVSCMVCTSSYISAVIKFSSLVFQNKSEFGHVQL